MNPEMDFFIFLIEGYAEYKGKTADKVLEEWDSLQLTDYIYSLYEIYRSERIENAFEDIDKLIVEWKCGLFSYL